MGLLDILLKTLTFFYTVVPVPPDRVDEDFDPAPFAPGKDYARFWLAEAQCDPKTDTGYLAYSRVAFAYGTRRIAIPVLIGPGSLRATGPANAPGSRFLVNKPLTPLFPYRNGPLEIMGALVRVEPDQQGYTRMMEQLAAILTSPAFGKMLDISDILMEGIQSRVRDRASMELAFQKTFSAAEPAAQPVSRLTPGYFAVLRNNLSRQPVAKSLDKKSLCVVNGSLRSATSLDFRRDNHPLPEEEFQYLLFRIEKRAEREDWQSLDGINTLVGQAVDAVRQGDAGLVREMFKRTIQEVFRSSDLTVSDMRRVTEAIRGHLKEVADPFGSGADTTAPQQTAPAVASLPALSSGDLEKEQKLQQASLQAAASSPYPDQSDECIFTIEYQSGKPLRLEMNEGAFGIFAGEKPLKLDVSASSRQAEQAFSGDWRFQVKTQGKQLQSELFDSVFWENYSQLKSADRNLHLRFRTELDGLRIPFEFLPTRDQRQKLVLEHPLCRSIIGDVPVTRRRPPSKKFFRELYRKGDSLSILLIASNTPPDIPRVDEEIQALAAELPKLFKPQGIGVKIKALPSDEATFDTVLNELKTGSYHIIHYAGHGVYDSSATEESHLPFWASKGRSGGVKQLRVPDLKWSLEDSQVQFVYLSCCVGLAQGEPFKLQDYDFLGITDGLLQSGVPSILGYRWPLVDAGGEKLSAAFYKYLAQEGEIDTALLLARREASRDREDRSWISPVLILQM